VRATTVLLISYEFPPKGGTQAQSTAKMAKALADIGWSVDVLTVSDPPASIQDEPLLHEVAGSLRIHRAFSLEPTRIVQAVRRLRCAIRLAARQGKQGENPGVESPPPTGAAPQSGSRGYTSLPRWAIQGIQALFWPDEKVGWLPWAVAEGLRSARTRGGAPTFSSILAVGPSFTSYLVAERLAKRLGIPWVADLRDPLYGGYFFKPLTPIHVRLQRVFETRVVCGADHVLVVTQPMKDEILERHPALAHKITVVPNAFDPADFASPPPPPRPGFVVAYVGTFQATIKPDTFFDALVALRDGRQSAWQDLRVRLVGARDPDTREAIRVRGLEDVVECAGFVPHTDAVQEMRAADALLFVLGPEPASRGIQTSKLPEYLASQRPILALIPEGAAADALRRYGLAEIVPPDSVAGTVQALLRLHEARKDPRIRRPNMELVNEYDRRRQAAHVGEILLDLVRLYDARKGGREDLLPGVN
jgi:glycosyltransferase involved in cell wall biosynthesis